MSLMRLVVDAVGFAFIGEPPTGERQGIAERIKPLRKWRVHNQLEAGAADRSDGCPLAFQDGT